MNLMSQGFTNAITIRSGLCVFLGETKLVCCSAHPLRSVLELPPSTLLDRLGCSDFSLEEDVWQDRNVWVPGEEMESL